MLFLLVSLVLGACTAPQASPPAPDTGYVEAPIPRSGDRIGPIAEATGNIQIMHLAAGPHGVLALARDHDQGRPPFFLLRYDEAQVRFSRIWLPTTGLQGFGAAFEVAPDGSAWIAFDGGPTKPQTLMRVRSDGSVDEWPIPPVAYPRVASGYISGATIREWRDGIDRELAPLSMSTGAAVPSELFYDFSPDGERLLAQQWVLLASGESRLQATHVARAEDGVLRPLGAAVSAQWSGAHTLFVTRSGAYELRTDAEIRTIGADAVPGEWLGAFDHLGRPLFGARRSNDSPDELTIAFTRATPWDGDRLGDVLLIPQGFGNALRFSSDGGTVAMTSRLFRSIDLSIFACR